MKNNLSLSSRLRKLLIGRLLLSAMAGIAFGLSAYNYFLVRIFPATSRRALLLLAVLSLMSALGYYLLLDRWLLPVFSGLKPSQRWIVAGTSTVLGILLLLAGTTALKSAPQNIVFLVPDRTVEIRAPAAQLVSDPQIVLLFFSTSAGDVSLEAVDFRGWKRSGSQLVLTDLSDNSFRWTGKIGEKAEFVFLRSPQGGYVNVSSDDFTETVNLNLDRNDKYLYRRYFSVPFYASREMVRLLAAVSFIALGWPLCLLAWRKRQDIVGALLASMRPSPARPAGGRQNPGMAKAGTPRWPLILSIMIAAFLLRAAFLGRAHLYLDEIPHLTAAKEVLSGSPLDSVYPRSVYTVTLPVALSTRIFGFNVWAARLPGVILNVLAIIPLYLLLEKVNTRAAVLGCILYATNPWVVAVARNVREYAYYPFYYYWIAYGMVVFLERVPDGLVLARDWSGIMNRRNAGIALGIVLPAVYAIVADPQATFRVILITYVVFFVFLLGKFDLRDRSNRLFLGFATAAVALAAFLYLSRLSAQVYLSEPDLNLLRYFFPNPPQQIYFDRLAIVFVLALAVAIFAACALYRHSFIPSFLSATFIASILAFIFFFGRYLRPRYLFNIQFWYLALLGIGLSGIWSVVHSLSLRRPAMAVLAASLLLPLSVNAGQALLPALYDTPGVMPVTDEYEYDLQSIETFMLAHAAQGDILVGTVYGNYASWRGVPELEVYVPERIFGGQMQDYIYALLAEHDSGWIVLDYRYHWGDLPRSTFVVGDKTVEYVGSLNNQLVWHWSPGE